jgi:hypothetical protein
MPDRDEPLACNTVEIFGAGIVKVPKSDLRYVCRSVLADKGSRYLGQRWRRSALLPGVLSEATNV